MKKPRSAKQLANDERLKETAKRRRELAPSVPEEVENIEDTPIQHPRDLETMARQIEEIQQSNALLQAALLGKQTAQVTDRGIIGVTDRYNPILEDYPDPRERLFSEPRFTQFALKENYVMEWKSEIVGYETKDGRNMQEPKFSLTLSYIVRDDDGEPTTLRHIVKRAVFFEDPAAAITVAREKGLEVDKTNQKLFLDEMRYLRIRDWLLDAFFPQPAKAITGKKEVVIGGRLVEVYEVSSEGSASIPFSEMDGKKKLRV